MGTVTLSVILMMAAFVSVPYLSMGRGWPDVPVMLVWFLLVAMSVAVSPAP